jgi:hypothetical protein
MTTPAANSPTPPQAPAVHTRPPEAVASDAAAEKAEFEARPLTTPEKKRMLVEQIKALEALEAREKLGARNLTPKQKLMDFTELEDKHPDRHFRWVNTQNEAKAEQRRQEGYVAVDDEMAKGTGCRTRLGNEFTLMTIPKSQAEARKAREAKLTSERMGNVGSEMREIAEQVSQTIAKRFGKHVSPEQIFIQMR